MCVLSTMSRTVLSKFYFFKQTKINLSKLFLNKPKPVLSKGTEPNCLGFNEKGSGERYDEEGDKWSCDGDAEGVRFDDSVDTMCTTCQDVYEGEEVHPK